ncbi:MAG: HEAT repeat domain-containing protein [Gemmataceae bacterium]|nr:HEAT repeat domain-containing protein [Gemmataceae bacterium]
MRTAILAISFVMIAAIGTPDVAAPQNPRPAINHLQVPPGFTVELVAAPPLVHHPVMANFDPRGRLFVAETAGRNLRSAELLSELPNLVRVLEPADQHGRFHKSHIFADRMSFPMGALWHRNALYVASPPSLWKLEDTKNHGVADRRREVVTKFGFTGNAADIHGPFLGPDGWLYWCDGRHGHNIQRPDGTTLQGKAARIFRCKHDGTGVEVVCGGGMDNPVEIAFTPEGEPFFTVNIIHNQPARNDAICFALEGAVYPWHDVYKEFPRTGALIPTIEDLGWVAPSGLMRYQSGEFGADYEGNLFSCQFNRNRIQRHVVIRDGAGFKMKSEDFLTSTDKNFHPTDVLEDADGSLLVIDTGGWFRIGCPTSKIAQPDIKGGIYRIRKTGAAVMADPRGLAIDWKDKAPSEIMKLLDDPRFMVRERAIEELAGRPQAVSLLQREVLRQHPSRLIRNAVWALARIDAPAARAVNRSVLFDEDRSVKLAAIHAAGMHRDAKAVSALVKLLDSAEDPAVRRQAATALGRIRAKEAVPALMDGVKSARDRFLEHALLYALIQIGDADGLTRYLHDVDPKLRRAALIALDQMPQSPLTREQITPLLATDDAALLKAALDVIAARPAWGAEIVGLLREWLRAPRLDAGRRDNLRELLVGLSTEASIQKLIEEGLRGTTIVDTRLALLESVARAPVAKTPPGWIAALGQSLEDPDERVIQQTIVALRSRNVPGFTESLQRLARDGKRLPETRVAALGLAAPRLPAVDPDLFGFLKQELAPDKPPLHRLAAAQAVAQSRLDDKQLFQLSGLLVKAGAMEMPHLLAAFESAKSDAVGFALVKSLDQAPGLASLSPTALERATRGFSKPVQDQARLLVKKLSIDVLQQRTKLDELEPATKGGDLELGRNVFYGPKASCAACHAVGGRGGVIGPDLTKIGAIRSSRDLLESVVFPSASFARGFEPFVVETKAGTVHQGIMARETADALVLVNADRHEVRVVRSDIDSIAPGRVSIMPQGLDAQLSRQELQHLLAFLQSLR